MPTVDRVAPGSMAWRPPEGLTLSEEAPGAEIPSGSTRRLVPLPAPDLPLHCLPNEVRPLFSVFKHGIDPLIHPVWQSYNSCFHIHRGAPHFSLQKAISVIDGLNDIAYNPPCQRRERPMSKRFPQYYGHKAVVCMNCDGPLGEPTDDGHPHGRGQYKATCQRCGMSTWYDLAPPEEPRRGRACAG